MANAAAPVSAPATALTKEGFFTAVHLIWELELPQVKETNGEWFNLSVRLPDSCWCSLTCTRTYGELVHAMQRVAHMLPEGVLVSASRCYGYDQYECSWKEQTFLLSQTGRQLRLQARS